MHRFAATGSAVSTPARVSPVRTRLRPVAVDADRLPTAIAHTDVLVVGGGVGGTAAALTLLRDHHRVVLTEPTGWIGGQLTSQGVPASDHAWSDEGLGVTTSYLQLRDRARTASAEHFPAEPAAWHTVLSEALHPYLEAGCLRLITEAVPEHVDARNGLVRSVTVRTPTRRLRVHARYVIDASELGDLLPLAGAPFVVGREAGRGADGTGEPHNPHLRPDPRVQQHFSVIAAVGSAGGNRRPAECRLYDRFEPEYAAAAPEASRPEAPPPGSWPPRDRLPQTGAPGTEPEVVLLNQPEQVCHERVLIPSSGPTRAGMFEAAVRLAAEKVRGLARYRGLFLEPDVFETDGLARYPYIREARRIRADLTITEQDVTAASGPYATRYPDSVGIGLGPIDVRHTDPIYLATRPFQIPLRALLPRRMRNLLAGAKNIGTTQIANGCYRYHSVEWSIGEAAGHACAFALRHHIEPRRMASDPTTFGVFASYLESHGVQRSWPEDRSRVEVADFGIA